LAKKIEDFEIKTQLQTTQCEVVTGICRATAVTSTRELGAHTYLENKIIINKRHLFFDFLKLTSLAFSPEATL
jgi:hypothetical protein